MLLPEPTSDQEVRLDPISIHAHPPLPILSFDYVSEHNYEHACIEPDQSVGAVAAISKSNANQQDSSTENGKSMGSPEGMILASCIRFELNGRLCRWGRKA